MLMCTVQLIIVRIPHKFRHEHEKLQHSWTTLRRRRVWRACRCVATKEPNHYRDKLKTGKICFLFKIFTGVSYCIKLIIQISIPGYNIQS